MNRAVVALVGVVGLALCVAANGASTGQLNGEAVVQVDGLGTSTVGVALTATLSGSRLTVAAEGEPWLIARYSPPNGGGSTPYVVSGGHAAVALEGFIAREVARLYTERFKQDASFSVRVVARKTALSIDGASNVVVLDEVRFHAAAPSVKTTLKGSLRTVLTGTLSENVEASVTQARIDRDGGVVGIKAATGEEISLAVPAGATDLPFDVRIVSLYRNTAHARFRIESSKSDFLKPIAIEVTLPARRLSPQADVLSVGMAGARSPLPTTADSSRRVHRTTTATLAPPIDVGPGAAQIATSRTAAEAANDEGGGLFTEVELAQLDCITALGSLHQRLLAVRSYGFTSVSNAARLIAEIQALQVCALDPNPSIEAALEVEMTLAKEVGCDAYASGKALFSTFSANTVAELRESSTELLSGSAMRDATGATCAVPPVDLRALMDERYTEFILRYAPMLVSQLLGGQPWRTLWGQLREVDLLLYDAAKLDLPQAWDAASNTLIPAMLSAFRLAAYRTCDADDTQQHLADLASGGALYGHSFTGAPLVYPQWSSFGLAEIVSDIQRCGSSITVKSFDGTELVDTASYTAPAAPGPPPVPGRVAMPIDGALQVTGSVLALRCLRADGTVTLGDDELVVRLDSAVVARRSHAGGVLPATLIDLDAGELFGAAGVQPQPGGSYMLTINREGSACAVVPSPGASPAQHYGPAEYELYRVEVQIDAIQGLVFVESVSTSNLASCNVYVLGPPVVQDTRQLSAPPMFCEASGAGTATVSLDSSLQLPALVAGQQTPAAVLALSSGTEYAGQVSAASPPGAHVANSTGVNTYVDVLLRVGSTPVRLDAVAQAAGSWAVDAGNPPVGGSRAQFVALVQLEVQDEAGTTIAYHVAGWVNEDPLFNGPPSFNQTLNLGAGWSVRIVGRASSRAGLDSVNGPRSAFGNPMYSLDLRFAPR